MAYPFYKWPTLEEFLETLKGHGATWERMRIQEGELIVLQRSTPAENYRVLVDPRNCGKRLAPNVIRSLCAGIGLRPSQVLTGFELD
jgi:hypothetical protein